MTDVMWGVGTGLAYASGMRPPNVTITETAARAVLDAAAEAGESDVLHLSVDARFFNDLFFGPRDPDDVVVTVGGVTLAMDRVTAKRADGVKIDFVEGADGVGFKLDNPNQSAPGRGVRPADVRTMLEKREKLELVDVRTEGERARASIAGSRLLDERYEAELAALPKGTKLVFLSHHSHRSRRAMQRFVERGFTNAWYVVGGIDAWSTMDRSVPRYGPTTQRPG